MSAILSLAFAALRGALPLLGGFFTGGLSWAWSLLSAFLGTDIGSKIAIGLACILGGFVWGFSHEHAVKTREVAAVSQARDAEWSQTIAKANEAAEQRIQEALNAARKVSDTPAPSSDALVELCRNSPSCRSALNKGQRVSVARRPVGAGRQPADNN